ncbi:MAG TPA: hypothetical protein VNZ45_02370, partial [Bacteroidia bacterium]|nr:hypothetical protein [Bacteroidia bacterium]
AGLWISGWQDNGSNISSPAWKEAIGGDGMTCFFDWSSDYNIYASTEFGNFYSSFDGGNTWYYASNGISEPGLWNTPWLQDPQVYGTLYAGFKNVWMSNDQGSSWAPISSWGTYYVSAIAVAPSNDQYIYAAQFGALYVTNNDGTSWTNINGTLPLDSSTITGIAIDPNNAMHVWVCCGDWNSLHKVYKSTDGGGTWTNISAGLPNLPVNCIVYQAGTPDGIYIGTDMGVYYMDNTTGGWIPFNVGLPNVEVFSLSIFAPGNLLFAGTFGRGSWQTPTYVNTGINEVSFASTCKVYPNPATSAVKIEASNTDGGSGILTIADITGRLVMQKNIGDGTGTIK